MRRLWLRWALLIVFVVVLGVVFVSMGEWQLERLAQRRERNATTIANEKAPIQPYEQVFSHPITDADQWGRVEARGTFDADHQFVVRYRSNGNLDGYEVVTPLRTASGVVLVDRGFIPLQRGVQQEVIDRLREQQKVEWLFRDHVLEARAAHLDVGQAGVFDHRAMMGHRTDRGHAFAAR